MMIKTIASPRAVPGYADSVRQAWMVWREAMVRSRRHSMQWVAALLLLATLALGIASVTGVMAGGRPVQSPALPLAILALLAWSHFVTFAGLQNTPANALLVPRLHASVRLAAVGFWLVLLLPGAWLASGFQSGALMMLLYVNMLSIIGWMRSGSKIGLAAYFALLAAALACAGSASVLDALSTTVVLAVLATVSVAFFWLVLRYTFPGGGEAHWRLLKVQAGAAHQHGVDALQNKGRVHASSSRLYDWKLRYDLRRSPTPGHLLLHALGPNNHRFDMVLPVFAAIGLCAGVWAVHPMSGTVPHLITTFLVAGLVGGLIGGRGLFLKRIVTSMERTSAEQALVRLAPGAPPATDLGTHLANELLWISLCEWVASAVILLAMSAVLGTTWTHMLGASALICTFAMSGWALRDYSDKDPGSFGRVLLQGLAVLAGGAAMVMTLGQPMWWGVIAVVMLVVGALIIRDRYRLMLAAPTPFPSGRF